MTGWKSTLGQIGDDNISAVCWQHMLTALMRIRFEGSVHISVDEGALPDSDGDGAFVA